VDDLIVAFLGVGAICLFWIVAVWQIVNLYVIVAIVMFAGLYVWEGHRLMGTLTGGE